MGKKYVGYQCNSSLFPHNLFGVNSTLGYTTEALKKSVLSQATVFISVNLKCNNSNNNK